MSAKGLQSSGDQTCLGLGRGVSLDAVYQATNTLRMVGVVWWTSTVMCGYVFAKTGRLVQLGKRGINAAAEKAIDFGRE